MRRQVYLKRDTKTGIYKYRRAYPPEVCVILGKATFIRTLNTKILSVANEAAGQAEKEYDTAVDTALSQGRVPLQERQEMVSFLKDCGLLKDDAEDIDLAKVRQLLAQTYQAMMEDKPVKGSGLPKIKMSELDIKKPSAKAIHRRFLKYAEKRKVEGSASMLFPNLSQSTDRRFTKEFSKWYGRYCQDIGLKDNKRLGFHSFRHGFKDVCREAGIPQDVHDKLTGHTSSANVGNSYGLGYTVDKLNEHLQRIRYEGLNVSHLYLL